MEQGRRAKLDIEERRHFAQMLRGYRATLAMELRTFNESVIDRRAHMEGAIAENYGPAGVPPAGLLLDRVPYVDHKAAALRTADSGTLTD